MIPAFTTSGVLPPFTGDSAAQRANASPYKVAMTDIVNRFATSIERITILEGLLAYREKLRTVGFTDGFQWIDGSFVEDCESANNRGRAPADVDVVTYVYRPLNSQGNGYMEKDELMPIVMANPDLFIPQHSKSTYHCDAYHEDLCMPSHMLVEKTAYWFGLFSHSRVSNLWKGILSVPMHSDDAAARAILDAKKQEILTQPVGSTQTVDGGGSC